MGGSGLASWTTARWNKRTVNPGVNSLNWESSLTKVNCSSESAIAERSQQMRAPLGDTYPDCGNQGTAALHDRNKENGDGEYHEYLRLAVEHPYSPASDIRKWLSQARNDSPRKEDLDDHGD